MKIISKIANKNNPVGFFDSGVGGLTVFAEFRKIMPFEDCIYFGDTKNMPYGEKSKEQLIEFSKKAFEFFEKQEVKAVVMACNTTSATVYDILKEDYPFKLYPIIQSVTTMLSNLPYKKIGVFATPATVNSHAYSKGITNKEVFEIACPEWVKIVENRQENSPEAVFSIKAKFDEMMKFNPDKIVLGCTHYPYLLNQLGELSDGSLYINPARTFAEFVKADLEKNNMVSDNKSRGYEKFYASANPLKFKQAADMFYPIKDDVKVL